MLTDEVSVGVHPMKSTDFVVTGPPRLNAIKHFPVIEFADYERRLAKMQETLQRVQQAYLGTLHRAIIVLEGWDTAGKGGMVRRLGWALDPRTLPVTRSRGITYSASGNGCRSMVRSLYSTVLGTAVCWSSVSRAMQPRRNGIGLITKLTSSRECCSMTTPG